MYGFTGVAAGTGTGVGPRQSDFDSSLFRIVEPLGRIVSLQETKEYLKVDTDDDDDLLINLLEAAETFLDGRDGILGRAVRLQTWRLDLPCFFNPIELPLPPTILVDYIRYFNTDNTLTFLPADQYIVVYRGSQGAWIQPAKNVTYPDTYIRPDAVRILFQAGYVSFDSPGNDLILVTIKQAVLLIVRTWYDGGLNEPIPDAVYALIAPIRNTYVG